MFSTLQSAGWDFSTLQDSTTINNGNDTPKIAKTGSGAVPSSDLHYPALVSLMNGQYYVEHHAIFGMMDIPIMLEAMQNMNIGWLGKMLRIQLK